MASARVNSLARPAVMILLLGSALWECLIAGVLYLKPEYEAAEFHIAITPDTLALSRFFGEFALFLAVVCTLAAWQIRRGNGAGRWLAAVCGLHWVVFGIALFSRYFEPRFLLMDTARGLAIVAAAYAVRLDKRPISLAEADI